MKLSDLVAYKTALDKLSARTAQREIELNLGKITHLVDTQKIQLGNFKQELDKQYDQIYQSIDQFEIKVNELKQAVKLQIELEEKYWFQESYRLYDQEMRSDSADYVLNRRPTLTEDDENVLRVRIQNYVDWQHPAMIIQPGLEKFVEDMVGFDPLYLVAQEHDLLVPAFEKFPEEYQRRLRLYTVKEDIDHEILEKIPDNQIGLCLVYNFFEFKPFEIVRKYLIEIYQKLKPGGTLIMTFNDCDRDKAVKLTEQHYCCYTPGSMVKQFASTVGYDHIFSWDNDGPTTWLELRKPGTLTSLRGGQTLAKIVHKSVAKSK
jgi:SAM-dependent methyltransferase